jgi:mannosyltransferase
VDAATLDPARPGSSSEPAELSAGLEVGARAQLTRRWRSVAVLAGLLTVAAGIGLRFWARSPLWLDEALTVDIARHPLSQLHALLREDGAPPLYYVLLHLWMRVFGTSNLAVRSLSGVISVLTLPVGWWLGRSYGREGAWATLVLLAASPFAIYYGTETRMYALVMLVSALGMVALMRALRRVSPWNLLGVATATAALLYTQYWALYLVATVAVWLLWRGRKSAPDPQARTTARWCFGALAVGCVAFVPWLPTFVFQAKHTGTPWAAPGNFGAIVSAITGFTDNQATLSTAGSNQGRLLAVLYLVLAFLAVFGMTRDRWHIDLDLRTRSRSRGLAFVVFGTLIVAVAGGLLTRSGYSNRYASIVFIPFLVLVVLGLLTIGDRRARLVVVAASVVAGLAVAAQNVTTQRTQAGVVASVLAAHARPGDVVAYCPDQLGPAVWRLTADRGYRQLTYPRSTGPALIDWINYKAAIRASSPFAFTRELQSVAGPGHAIWLVWASGYQGFGTRCEQIATELIQTPGYGGRTWVVERPSTYYEPMNLTEYAKVPVPGPRQGP